MSKEVLIIGSYFAEGLKSSSWSSELPNLSDYDIIILDTTKILYGWLIGGRVKHLDKDRYYLSKIYKDDEKIRSNVKLVQRKLLEILEFDVTVYVLYSPEASIVCNRQVYDGIGETYEGFLGTNDWCPIDIDIIPEKGTKIYVKDKEYSQYFKDFKGWEYFFTPESLNVASFEDYYDKKWKLFHKWNAVAINKVNKPLAIRFCPVFCALREDKIGWYPETSRLGGQLIMLPVFDFYHTESLIEQLLKISKMIQATPPPEWLNFIEIPGESSLKQKLFAQKAEMQEVEARIKSTMETLSESQKIKGILYETGLTLQELIKSTLKDSGADIEPSPVSDEFIIKIGGKRALVEVKGNTKSITKGDLGQLITDLGEYLKTKGEDIDGILIGNAWRLEPLELRDKHDKPIFSQAVIKIAENRNIGLLSTTELFGAYCQVLEDPKRKEDILSLIIGQKGVIKF